MNIRPVRPALAGLALCLLASAFAMAAPTVSSFTPASGAIGSKVIINGSGFTGATAVMFNGVAATSITVLSDTKMTTFVPNAGSTGPISVTAGGLTGSSSTNFTVTPSMLLSFYTGHPYVRTVVYGGGFHAFSAVDLYFDSVDTALVVASDTGTIATAYFIPASAQPGQHWITFVERGSGWGAQKAFTVQTDWQEMGFSGLNRGYNPYENTIASWNVSTLLSSWSANAGGFGNQSPFVVAGGSVFVGDVIGGIHAYSASGALLWTASPGSDMQHVGPAAGISRVFFGDNAGNVRAYSQTCRSDGGVCTPLWTTNIGSAVTAGLSFFKGVLYAPAADGSIHTLNPYTGVQGTAVYGFDTSHGAVTTPLSFDTDGSFYYGVGALIEYHLASGSAGYVSFGGTVSPIAVNSGSAYFTTTDGRVHRFGSGNWDVATSGTGCAAAPVYALGYVYAGGCTSLAAYSPKTGAVLWSIPTGIIQGVSEANGVLYVCEGPYGANLEAYDAYYGGYYWTGGYCNSAPEVVNGNVFSAFAYLYAYDFPAVVGAIKPAPRIESLHPDYSLQPKPSGTADAPKPQNLD